MEMKISARDATSSADGDSAASEATKAGDARILDIASVNGQPHQLAHAPKLEALLGDIDEWLGNEEGLLIEDVIEWREKLATALGKPPRD